MAFTIVLAVRSLGSNSGPFNVYSDADNYQSIVGTITQSQLAGGTTILVPDGTTMVYLLSTGICGTFLWINVLNLPTPTPTISPTPTVTPTITPTHTPTITPTRSVMVSRPVFTPSPTPSKSCLVYNTPVIMADGTSKFIQDIKEGEEILSILSISDLSETNNITLSTANVTYFSEASADYIVDINNGLLKTSDSHIHVIKRDNIWGLKEAKDLQVGDILIDIDNNEIIITSVNINNDPQTVYYISVDKEHVYFANNILTHNKSAMSMCDCGFGCTSYNTPSCGAGCTPC